MVLETIKHMFRAYSLWRCFHGHYNYKPTNVFTSATAHEVAGSAALLTNSKQLLLSVD